MIETQQKTPRIVQWHGRVLGICLAIFAIEIGLILMLYPWSQFWEMNWVPLHSPTFGDAWMSPYFRGAVSGLGILNVLIGIGEGLKQLRKPDAKSREDSEH